MPAATRVGSKVTISFALSEPTDVEVAIIDAKGNVVRHLAAGVLGGNSAPPAPLQAGLSQTLEWDGRDDLRKPAKGAPLKARVRIGLKAEFDCFIGWEEVPPLGISTVNGIAVGPDRSLYVISIEGPAPNAGRSENRLWVLSREGKYLRTLYPYPATTDPEKLRGADFLKREPNRLTPRVYDRVCPSYLPQMRALNRQTMAATSDGRLVFVNGWGTELYGFGPRCLLVMNTDGSIPRGRLDGPTVAEGINSGYAHVALAPDEKSAYVCGLHFSRYLGKPHHGVYHVGLGVGDKPQLVFGQKNKPLGGTEGLTDPRGIGVDRQGRVYVSDFGNNRIVVLDPVGSYLGEIPVKGPSVLAVHPSTDAIYVISLTGGKTYKLVKFAGFKDPEVAGELDLSQYGGVTSVDSENYHPVMALDPHGRYPIVYLGSPSEWARYRLLRVEDEGAELKPTVVNLGSRGQFKGFPYPQGVDAEGNFFFLDLRRPMPHGTLIKGWEVKADTGEIVPWPCEPTYRYAVGKDGFFYRAKWYTGKAVTRTDRAGEVVAFSATGEMCEPYSDWRFFFTRSNLHILPSGDIWALYARSQEKPFGMVVSALGPDGRMKRRDVVQGLQGAASLRLDSRGNIYVADGLNLDGRPYPPEIGEFARRLRAEATTKRGRHSEAVEDVYGEGYGSILKFGPEGGSIRKAETAGTDEKLLSGYPGTNFAAKGLKGIYPRISPMAPPRYAAFSACWCLHATFDIDAYDRLFVPDALQFCVRVLDANFNEIMTFGGYDSATDRGGKANLPGPEIPFEYPSYVNAADAAVYVTDSASCARRIVRVKLTYAAEETCFISQIGKG
jgi:DNA-binding beta-propeller fold protein YncE